MDKLWVGAALVGLAAFLAGLIGAAWRGQTAAGSWRPRAWAWALLAAAGLALLLVALQRSGAAQIGLHYPAR